MVTGCLRKIEKINICMKLAKMAFLLLMKIWDAVYIFKIGNCNISKTFFVSRWRKSKSKWRRIQCVIIRNIFVEYTFQARIGLISTQLSNHISSRLTKIFTPIHLSILKNGMVFLRFYVFCLTKGSPTQDSLKTLTPSKAWRCRFPSNSFFCWSFIVLPLSY